MENKRINFSDILTRQSIFLARSDVLFQLLIIIVCLFLGWLLSKLFWHWLQRNFPQFTTFIWRDEHLEPREYLALFLQSIDFPLITLILLNLMAGLFHSQNWTQGLIKRGEDIVIVYLILRCLLAFLYGAFPLTIIQEYQFKIFYPLFVLFVFNQIVNLSGNLQDSQVQLITLFNNPITFDTIYSLIVGLYFWIVIVILLEKLYLILINSKTLSEKSSIQATLILCRYFLITLGIIINLGFVGVDGRAVTAIGGGLSIGIGFALKEIFSNFMSGIILLFEKILKPGDMISIEGQTCQVKELGIRATTVLMTVDNAEKIIPNQIFLTQDVTTYTGSNNLVYCSILMGVGYDSNAEQVTNLLLKIAHNHPKILTTPSPVVFFINFGDSSLNFELKFWLNDINTRKRVISDINCSILTEFAKSKIEIPFPQRDVNIKDIKNFLN
ncbi:mechanosensitive ion channel domain-containing protein [Geminocystis sp. GBBB08]|uniref:mechanosensitive ion channel family protein n=1 Tax=Geminocystis sp. GBBB08 TaxID=2604140 RepID=UPI0027E24D18|nr:mechanosensitive ion channel domain-containing protein [Geminocystis sp. GBBB08]MBL1209753.1 mechanosensitive ion channel [Geminocystis sp. GBBB08]